MKRLFAFLLGIGLSAPATFAAAPSPQSSWNVFGSDNRVPLTSTDSPWRTIGKLDMGCTGTLVGKNLVLTAAHCVMKDGKLGYVGYFHPNFIDGSSDTKSWVNRVTWGTAYPDKNRESDWAILELDDNLGDTYGWMGASTTPRYFVTLVGYSGDFYDGNTAGVHVDCTYRSTLGSTWLHDCDMTRGASGGPMFYMNGSSPVISAINVAERRDNGDSSLNVSFFETSHANIAVPASAFISTLRRLKGE